MYMDVESFTISIMCLHFPAFVQAQQILLSIFRVVYIVQLSTSYILWIWPDCMFSTTIHSGHISNLGKFGVSGSIHYYLQGCNVAATKDALDYMKEKPLICKLTKQQL